MINRILMVIEGLLILSLTVLFISFFVPRTESSKENIQNTRAEPVYSGDSLAASIGSVDKSTFTYNYDLVYQLSLRFPVRPPAPVVASVEGDPQEPQGGLPSVIDAVDQLEYLGFVTVDANRVFLFKEKVTGRILRIPMGGNVRDWNLIRKEDGIFLFEKNGKKYKLNLE